MRKKWRELTGLCLVAGLILIFTEVANANFADTYGFSASGIARGNAMTAVVNDWSAVYYNMAGLGRTRDALTTDQFNDQLALTLLYTSPDLKIKIERSDVKGDQDLDFTATSLGLVLDLNHFYQMPEVFSSARFGLGLGIIDAEYLAKVNDIDLRTHNFIKYGREIERIVILTGVGFGFKDDLFGFGLGANVLFGGDGKIMMSSVEVGADEQIPDAQTRMDLKTEIAPVLGFYFSPGNFDFGLAYRGEVTLEIDPLDAGAILEAGNAELDMYLSIFDYYTPAVFSMGVAYTLGPCTMSIDVELQDWSGYQISDSRKDSGIKTPKLDDVIVPKVGLAWSVSPGLDLMAGYYYEPSCVPDKTNAGRFNLLDNDKHVISSGCEFKLPHFSGMTGPLSAGVGIQYQILENRSVTKTAKIQSELNPNYDYEGTVITAILEIKYDW